MKQFNLQSSSSLQTILIRVNRLVYLVPFSVVGMVLFGLVFPRSLGLKMTTFLVLWNLKVLSEREKK